VNLLLLLLVPIGVAVGAFSAAFGIGGGLMMVPVMVIAYGLDQHAAQGTSLVVIVPTALVGAIAHHRRGLVDWRAAGFMAAGGIAGVFLGARVALATGAETLQTVFGVVVIAAGIRLGLQGRSRAAERQ
jgi:uncharacterized membrane protein YfcA